ncbi:MAG: MerR family transcriptional regulator [Propionibacteriaceae bacterium]|jgi:DNA-binding transcriptional MerR regulator/effector-binding domain-containing protein|nr:MerR family transcriptional regulator [Propionibacteriaceae bacterium]
MYQIGEFSKLGRVSVKALRYYDEIGLLAPAEVDQWTGYRYYSTEQLYQLHEIVALRQMGFSIEQIAAIVSGAGDTSLVEARLATLETEQRTVSDQLFRVRHYLRLKKEGYEMEYKVVVKEIPSCTVFSSRQKVADYTEMLSLIPAVGAKVAADNPQVSCCVPEYCCNVCHDTEYQDTNMDIEICQAVTTPGEPGDGYEFKTLPAVTVASVLHRGPYDGLGAAYAFAIDWVQTNGYQVAGDWREAFIDGIWNKDSEAEWLTELQLPITK